MNPLVVATLALLLILLVAYLSLKFYKLHRYPICAFKKFFSPLPSQLASITAVVPNYNYANYLEERIGSILSQKYPVSELIILDDCSTDDSLAVINRILKNLQKTRPQLKTRLIRNSQNSGNVFTQWAKAFQYATGDYLWICEADDTASPYFLKQVMPPFAKDQKVVLSYAESRMLNERGKQLMSNFRGWADYQKSGHWKKSYINDGKNELENYLAINNTIINVSAAVFKNDRSIPFAKYLKTAATYRLAGDWYFYSKILLHGKIAYNAETLSSYRSHAGSVSKTTDDAEHYQEIVRVQDSIASDVNIPPAVQAAIDSRRATFLQG